MENQQQKQLTLPGGMPYGFEDICRERDSKLEELVLRGVMPDIAQIAGWEFKGRNTSMTSKLLNIRRFIKGFCAISQETQPPEMIDGYNLWVWQERGLKSPWRPMTKSGKPWRHGFFKVHPVEPDQIDNKYPNALLIDYSLAKNPFYHPGAVLRDYFVQVYKNNPDLYIGKAYAALGSLRILGGYFVIERANRSEIHP